MDTSKILMELSGLTGVAGQETSVATYISKILSKYGEVSTSNLGCLVCCVQKPKENQPHLMFDAHMDEIGMIVTYIEDKGFIRVGAVGGVDRRILLASKVTIHCAQGDITGIICSIPPHLSGDSDKKNKKPEEIYIDIGYSAEKSREIVKPGDHVTISTITRKLLGDLITGKAIDDRAGCVAILNALERLKNQELNCGLTVVFSTMEEVGGAGIKTAAYSVNPTHAIAIDVGYGYTPDSPREKCGDLQKGPMIGFAPILSKELSNKLVQISNTNKIMYQPDIMGGSTGTNADYIAVTRAGVYTGLLSIPQKYMHTSIETVSAQDVENTGYLLAEYAKTLGGAK